MTCACRPICIASPRTTLPTWSTHAARAVPTRRLPQHAASFLSRLLPCRTPAHVAADQVGEFCRMALPILRDYTDLTAPAALDAVAPEASFHFEIGVDDARDLHNYGYLRRLVGRSL